MIHPLLCNAKPNFYPRSPCGERLFALKDQSLDYSISIHALLAESDKRIRHRREKPRHFYPRSPCGERQDTAISALDASDFYPRSPCGERPPSITPTTSRRNFYPRSPCGERHTDSETRSLVPYFYPRSPCGERLQKSYLLQASQFISIHALLAESDGPRPQPPKARVLFLSTLSLRRATLDFINEKEHASISIHALLAESDSRPATVHTWKKVFLSTLSLRRATYGFCEGGVSFEKFLSTLSLRRATLRMPVPAWIYSNFYPRSPCGERLRQF